MGFDGPTGPAAQGPGERTWNRATSCGSGSPISLWSRTRLLTCDSICSTCDVRAGGCVRQFDNGLASI